MTTPGERVKKLRRSLNMSVKGFAKELGVSLYCIYTWESESRRPGKTGLAALKKLEARKESQRPKRDGAFHYPVSVLLDTIEGVLQLCYFREPNATDAEQLDAITQLCEGTVGKSI